MSEGHESLIDIKSVTEEPFVFLEDGNFLSDWNKTKEITYNQQLRQRAKVDFYKKAFDFLCAHDIKGDYFEFGCHKVRTFRMALTEARKKNMSEMNFFAFDSFEGLPAYSDNADHSTTYTAQQLTTSEMAFWNIVKEHNIYVDKVKVIKGFYEQVLNTDLKARLRDQGTKIALVTLDCSLYKSFVLAFDFIENFLQEGAVLYVDDYRVTYKGSPIAGIPKAFKEYSENSAFKFEPFLDISWFGKSFFVYK